MYNFQNKSKICLIFSAMVFVFASCSRRTPPVSPAAPMPPIPGETLGLLSSNSTPMVISSDGLHVAFYTSQRGVYFDGVVSPSYKGLYREGPTLSPDGQHLAYVASKGTGSFVDHDRSEGATFEGIGERVLRFSPDSKQLAYLAYGDKGKFWFAVRNGRESDHYDAVDFGPDAFSPDSSRFVFIARKKDAWFIVEGGRAEPVPGDGVIKYTLNFSPDSKHIAYVAGDGNKSRVVLDGKPGPDFDAVGRDKLNNLLYFSPDGSHLAYVAKKGREWHLVIDGRQSEPHESFASGAPGMTFSPDSARLSCVQRKGDLFRVAVYDVAKQGLDPSLGSYFDAILEGTPVFSHDGRRQASAVKKAGKWHVIVDDKEGPAYDLIGSDGLKFSPDGKRLVYFAANAGIWRVVDNGVEGPPYEAIGADSLFSPDGSRFAYTAKRGPDWFLILDGLEGSAIGGTVNKSMHFSQDGKHLAYGRKRHGKFHVVRDGVDSPPFDLLFENGPIFQGDSLRYLAGRNGLLHRVKN